MDNDASLCPTPVRKLEELSLIDWLFFVGFRNDKVVYPLVVQFRRTSKQYGILRRCYSVLTKCRNQAYRGAMKIMRTWNLISPLTRTCLPEGKMGECFRGYSNDQLGEESSQRSRYGVRFPRIVWVRKFAEAAASVICVRIFDETPTRVLPESPSPPLDSMGVRWQPGQKMNGTRAQQA